jgi:hypothetical protein
VVALASPITIWRRAFEDARVKKGYIYIERYGYDYIERYGYDPDKGKSINDPYLGDVPTLGACVPNIRGRVVAGDHIFFVSGKVQSAHQFVIGGFEVSEKIPATEAYARFPKLRLHLGKNGEKVGNIIVDRFGRHDPLDDHHDYEHRIANYSLGEILLFSYARLKLPTPV